MPDNQFGFKKSYSREHIHRVIANVLLDVEENKDIVIMAGHDVSRAFDVGIHPQLLLSASHHGLDRSILRVYKHTYSKLHVFVKVPVQKDFVVSKTIFRIWKGIRQGGVSSPPFYNKSVLEAQKKVQTSFIFRGLDLSLLNYADDVLNLSRTISDIEENFEILFPEYKKIGLKFNAEKVEVVSIGMSRNRSIPDIVCLDGHPVKLSPSINYLGLPIGSDLKHSSSTFIRVSRCKASQGVGSACSL